MSNLGQPQPLMLFNLSGVSNLDLSMLDKSGMSFDLQCSGKNVYRYNVAKHKPEILTHRLLQRIGIT